MPKQNKGSMLVMASFILLTMSLLSASFWKILRINQNAMGLKEGQIRAFYAARGAIEDSLYELKEGNWGDENNMSVGWQSEGDGAFSKSNKSNNALRDFEYPVTYSVQIIGNMLQEAITINSRAQVTSRTRRFESRLQARVVRTLAGEFHIVGIKEN